MKVVYNAVYGGFSISMKCAKLMAEMGSLEAQCMLKAYEYDGICQWWYGYWEGSRHDPILVKAVEAIGYGAGESDCDDREGIDDQQIKVYTLKQGTKYIIQEHSGLESVIEPNDIVWIDSKPTREVPTGDALSLELKI